MMHKTRLLSLAAALAVSLAGAACSKLEAANEGKGYAGKADTPAYSSRGGEFSDGGWTAGDKTTWTEAMKNRAKSQNEYLRTAPAEK